MNNVESPLLLPGIKMNTSPTNYRGYSQMQLVKVLGGVGVWFVAEVPLSGEVSTSSVLLKEFGDCRRG